MTDRAVSVVLQNESVLLIRRRVGVQTYSVLPGGGIETEEKASDAALRELEEETSLRGKIVKPLAVLNHEDRLAHYFLVEVSDGELCLGGPEVNRSSETNQYKPEWVLFTDLDSVNLQPANAYELVQDLIR